MSSICPDLLSFGCLIVGYRGISKFTANSAHCRNANFEDTQFNENANFMSVQFGDDNSLNMDFERASFDGNVCFVDAQFGQCADFRGACFNRSLNLTHARFERLEIGWNSTKGHLICDDTAYMALIRNYKNLAWFDDANECLYDYRDWGRRNSPKLLDSIAWLSCGYGVRPLRTLFLSLGIILFFGIVFGIGDAIQRPPSLHHITCPCKLLPENPRTRSYLESLIDSTYFSALVFITHPPPDWRPSDRWRYAVLLEDILGWLFLALFLVTLGNVMII